MEFLTYVLIILGILAIGSIFCTILLYPEMKELVKALNEDS